MTEELTPQHDEHGQDESTGGRRTALIAAGVIGAVVVVGGGGWLLGRGSGDATPAAPKSSAGGVANEGIVPGKGGSSAAPDGVTPVGFPATCVGAVAAASAYTIALQNQVPSEDLRKDNPKPGQPRPGLEETLDRILIGEQPHVRKTARPGVGPGFIERPEEGGYKVLSCTPGKAAEVAIFSCGSPVLKDKAGKTKKLPQRLCSTGQMSMRYGGEPADWRVADSPITVKGGAVEGEKPLEREKRLSAAKRKALLGKKPGWKEYTNAPRT